MSIRFILNINIIPGVCPPGMALAVEQAKLLWATGRHRATTEIQEALDDVALRGANAIASRAMLRLAREPPRGSGPRQTC